jgi:bifunctional ADP-heptose synthase (sugar kinase/adenylyltransferase)
VVTRGSIGAEWNNKVFGTRQVQVSDVSGAGDTFLAVLSLQYVRFNRQMETAIIMANKASSYVVQKSGTYSLKEEDIEKLRF